LLEINRNTIAAVYKKRVEIEAAAILNLPEFIRYQISSAMTNIRPVAKK